jgi:acyl dehydratase
MARLWARTVSFESVAVGDELPILVKWETEETIAHFNAILSPLAAAEDSRPVAPAGPAGSASANAAGAPGSALSAYVVELLEKGFPITSIYAKGSRLEVRLVHPVRPGDTMTLTGQVVSKRAEGERRLVECEVVVENQEGLTVARALAALCL